VSISPELDNLDRDLWQPCLSRGGRHRRPEIAQVACNRSGPGRVWRRPSPRLAPEL